MCVIEAGSEASATLPNGYLTSYSLCDCAVACDAHPDYTRFSFKSTSVGICMLRDDDAPRYDDSGVAFVGVCS